MIAFLKKTSTLVGLITMVACAGEFKPMSDGNGESGGGPGPVTDPGSQTKNAKANYDANVEPLMDAKCSSCHGGDTSPVFLTKVAGSSHGTIMNFSNLTGNLGKESARILAKGAHSGSDWWDANEIETIEAWFDAEVAAAASGGGGGVTPNPQDASVLAVWSGCMKLENWEESQMGTWADKQTLQGVARCQDCHDQGLWEFNANPDSTLMFQQNRYEKMIGAFFGISIDPANGESSIIADFNKIERFGNGTTGHPTFRYDSGDIYIQRLQQFYDLTNLTIVNGQCDPAGFPVAGAPPAGAEE